MASADILYTVTPSAQLDQINVEIRLQPKGRVTSYQMPSWSPGLYVKEDYWKAVASVSAKDELGRPVPVEHLRDDTWQVENGNHKFISLSYQRPAERSQDRLGMFSGDEMVVHYSGPTVYMYVVDRKQEKCQLRFETKPDQKVAVSLKPVESGFEAHDYDELADCPVTLGKFIEDSYTLEGKKYTIALRGPAQNKINQGKLKQILQNVSETETKYFGGAPFDRYVWHVQAISFIPDGGGGVEHSSSTQVFASTGMGPGMVSGMAHEFFHLWNVKRIRSQQLGPFDYTKLPRSGDLWWLEGVTDYYAYTLPFRAGYGTRQLYFQEIQNQLVRIEGNPARREVSPWESGYKTPEANNSHSSGYKVDYYPTGWILGLMFDIELRSRTEGKSTLDDVELALWEQCKGGSAFKDGAIRKLLVRFGGQPLGKLYDTWVMHPGQLPYNEVLAKAALIYENGQVKEKSDSTPEQVQLRETLLKQGTTWKSSE